MEKNIGIVLKNYYPQKQKLVVLDKKEGKIQCVPNRIDIPNGAILAYTKVKKHIHLINNIEILDVPFDIAGADINFLHAVLEICYYFIPSECPNHGIFELLLYLYSFPNKIKYIIDKKLFLFKLFISLGIYPEGKKFQTPYLHNLASESIDIIVGKDLHLDIEKDIDECLLACIEIHPMFRYFKTVNFFFKIR